MFYKSKVFFLILIGIGGVYGLIYWDVCSRAKESYLEGERYMEWAREPAKKKDFFEKKFQTEKNNLDRLLAQKKVSDDIYRQKLEALQFDREYLIGESSLKYAYQWYKDTHELFSPPESKWVKMARVKAPEALDLWKQELRDQKIPFEDTMFE